MGIGANQLVLIRAGMMLARGISRGGCVRDRGSIPFTEEFASTHLW